MSVTPPEPPPAQPTPPPAGPPAPPAGPPTPPPPGAATSDPYAAPQQPYQQQAPNQQYGQPAYQQPGYTPSPPTDGLAVAALITGILAAPVGIVLGLIALAKLKTNGKGGKILAILGVVFGAVGTLAGIAVIVISILSAIAIANATNEFAENYGDTLDDYSSIGEVQDSVAVGAVGTTSDGFQFTVNSVTCGITTVGEDTFSVTADGQYCLVDVTAYNGTTEPQYFGSTNATGYIGDIEYSSDSEPAIYEVDGPEFFAELNPGETGTSHIYFDIPPTEALTRVELEAGFLGGIVEVVL